MVEERGWPGFARFCFLAPWIIGAALLVFEPRLNFCGGLSGLASGMMTLAALGGLSDAPPCRWVCLAALAGMVVQNLFESVTGHCVFVTVNGMPAAVSVTSHIAGAATALIFFAHTKLKTPSEELNSRAIQGILG
jgi:hypothetical protein